MAGQRRKYKGNRSHAPLGQEPLREGRVHPGEPSGIDIDRVLQPDSVLVLSAETLARLLQLQPPIGANTASEGRMTQVVVVADLEIDHLSHVARCSGQPLSLTERELVLLGELMHRYPEALSFKELAMSVWTMSTSEMPSTYAVRSNVFGANSPQQNPG